MDVSRKDTLREYHQDLRTGVIINNILPALRPLLTDVEYANVRDQQGNVARVDELIDILLTKDNVLFDGFCEALKENGYKHWAKTLREKVGAREGKQLSCMSFGARQLK